MTRLALHAKKSMFETGYLLYRPDYPSQPFSTLTEARRWVAGFTDWYNLEHRHNAIQFVTPAQRHTGLDTAILAHRKTLYEAAKARRPERWSRETRNWTPVRVVHLNPDKSADNERANTLENAA